MGKRIGAVIVSALFVIFLVAVFGIPTSVESVYPTPTPTPPVGSCTGYSDCTVVPGSCGGSCAVCESYSTTTCRTPKGVPVVCNEGCSNNTACTYTCPSGQCYCSTPPAGCPSDRSGCSWSGANDCGGGVCGCGERRTATLWCSGQHCDDICTSDQACTVECNAPTPMPTSPPSSCPDCGTPPNCYSPYCSPSCPCDCFSTSCSGGVCNPGSPYCSPSCACDCSSLSCSGGVCNPPPCTPYCSPSCTCGCSSLSLSGGVCNPPPCTPYCSPSCTCNCSSLSLSGGVCKPEPFCSPSCTYGCSSLSCSGGVCVIPGTIQARAMQVSSSDTSCTAVRNGTGIGGTVHQFTPSSASQPAPKTQSGSSYVVFNSLIPGSYTISSQPPSEYVLARACWTDSASGTSGEGLSYTLSPADTLTWDLGYTSGVAWSQVQGGDVYAGATLQSYVPVLTSPRAFILDGAGGYPGIAVYGQNYNFDSSGATHGQTWVSSKNWLVNDMAPATDFYQLMYRQFGSAPTAVDYTDPISPITQPASRVTPYYVTGDMTTSGDWMVGAGSIHVERIIKT